MVLKYYMIPDFPGSETGKSEEAFLERLAICLGR